MLSLTQETKAEYLTVSRKAFSEEGGSIVDAVIDSPTRRGYLLCREGKTVGVFDLDVEERQIFLYGVAVAEQFRCRGYGREIVNCALREDVYKRQQLRHVLRWLSAGLLRGRNEGE